MTAVIDVSLHRDVLFRIDQNFIIYLHCYRVVIFKESFKQAFEGSKTKYDR